MMQLPVSRSTSHRGQRGQTLVMALLILGIMLGLGFIFAGLISRNISQTGRSLERTRAGDLAEAGVRFAHTQMLFSDLGADWRPAATPPITDPTGFSRDPDALYLRQGTGIPLRGAADTLLDRGGPDGLGPFARVNFDRGRALIRVLYLPSDRAVFNSPTGVVRRPGKARNYIRIESIGRVGRINVNDPTTLSREGQQVAGFANDVAFRNAVARLRQIDAQQVDQKRLLGFVSLGLTEHARFITNKYNVTREAEIGSLTAPDPISGDTEGDGLGITHEGSTLALPTVMGGDLFDAGGNLIVRGTGSLFSNADLVVHGQVRTVLNPDLGDAVQVAGRLRPANSLSQLILDRVNPNGTITSIPVAGNNLNSNTTNFRTEAGLLRDASTQIDPQGYSRAIGRKEPPSFLATDPSTGLNRYENITRRSGAIGPNGNTGTFGHGEGIWVSASDIANQPSEEDRQAGDPARNLINDWLRPNNSNSVAWKGPFYIPIAAYMKLTPDGFTITRDARSSSQFQRTWRRPDGSDSGQSTIRYRLRSLNLPSGERVTYFLNSVANPAAFAVPAATISDATYLSAGVPFNGVILFQGDVRVRGVIPTDQQITVASRGSIYIEGSITKGVVLEDGTVLNRPSRSMLMLMAKDYMVVNTTMFFGPSVGENPASKRVDPLPNTPNPVELVLGGSDRLRLSTEFLLNPIDAAGRPNGNPQTWEPFANNYVDAQGSAINPGLLLTHSADDNGPSFVQLGIRPQAFFDITATPTQTYLWPRSAVFNAVAGAEFPNTTGNIPIYGLASPQINAYPRFETVSVAIATGQFTLTGNKLVAPGANAFGQIQLGLQDSTELDLQLSPSLGLYSSKNYALARTAVNPHDIRIEAAMFAEEGSFFVIPGPPFNFNSEDTRARFDNDVTQFGLAAAQQRRYEERGALPLTPFFGEPLNVRVSVLGSITENMPAPIGQQAEWQRRWGWMPRILPGSDLFAPAQHIPVGWPSITGANPAEVFLPNLVVTYDPVLALASADGQTSVRRSPDGQWVLPPAPRLPVSPKFAYFGEDNR